MPEPDDSRPLISLVGLRGELSFVVCFLLIILAAAIGPRNEISDALALFKPDVGEGFEWELALLVLL